MGRTNATYRDTLRALEDQWADYRRGLRRDEQDQFDRLFEYARSHADASGYLNHPEPMYALLVSIALEQEAQLEEIAARIETLEEVVDTGNDGPEG